MARRSELVNTLYGSGAGFGNHRHRISADTSLPAAAITGHVGKLAAQYLRVGGHELVVARELRLIMARVL